MDYQGKKAAFYTLGCKLNFAETSAMAHTLEEAGFEKVDFGGKADVYIINTCSVTNAGDKESRNIIRREPMTRNFLPSDSSMETGCP